MKRLLTALLLFCLTGAAHAASTGVGLLFSGGSSLGIPTTLFGQQTQGVTPPYTPGTQDWPTVPFGVLGKGTGQVWPYLETARGTYAWGTMDAYVAAGATNSIPIMYTFEYTPGWAISGSSTATCTTLTGGALGCPALPDSMTDFTDFVTALVTRYCPGGVPGIQYYELYNEPYDVYGTSNAQLLPAALATLTHAAYNIIRSNCPAAKIIAPDFGMEYNAGTGYPCTGSGSPPYVGIGSYPACYFQALGAVGTDPVDIASVHIYADSVATGSSSQALPEALMPPSGALYNSTVAGVLATYAPGKPVWNTEGSWGTNGDTTLSTTTSGQAAFVARWYLLHWAAGYRQASWYQWDNGTYGTLCYAASGPCVPVAVPTTAYTQTYDWMVGRTMTSVCSASGTVWTCGLTGAASTSGSPCATSMTTLVVWDTSGSSSFTPPSPSTYSKYCDLTGTSTSYGGSGAVTIGVAPILFGN